MPFSSQFKLFATNIFCNKIGMLLYEIVTISVAQSSRHLDEFIWKHISHYHVNNNKEMVSPGDTDISLHIPRAGVCSGQVITEILKCQDLPEFQFLVGRWRILCQVKVKTQSAKIWLNFNFPWGGGVVLCQIKVKTQSVKSWLNFNFQGVGATLPSQSQDSKHQDLAKFQFPGAGVVLCQVKVKTQSAKIWLNFNFPGGMYSGQTKVLKCQDLPKLNIGGRGYSGQVKTEKS